MLTMGSVVIFVMCYFFKLFMIPIFIEIRRRYIKTRSFFHHLIRRLLFKDIHLIIIEAYIEFLIAMYFSYHHPLFTTTGEKSAIIFSIFIFLGTTVFIPFSFIYVLKQPLSTIQYNKF